MIRNSMDKHLAPLLRIVFLYIKAEVIVQSISRKSDSLRANNKLRKSSEKCRK